MSGGLADLARLDATAQLVALAARRIGAAELLEASVAQAAATAGLNAVVRRDLVNARARAKAIDDRRARGETAEDIGLLAGLPMTIKDTFDVEGMPASSGVKALLDRGAGDAAAVAKVRAEGAVIWGKTNVPPMAADAQTYNRLYGTTNNPFDASRTPGGSSGGAAAALAAGITPLEIGSDMSGSLRIPASFCGVFAHKPTYGLVPQRGHVPPEPGSAAEADMNVVGPMARSARDLRLLLSILTNAPLPARSPAAVLLGLKVAVWTDEPAFVLDPEVRAVIETLADRLSAEGAHVDMLDHLIDARALMEAFSVLLFSETGTPLSWLRMPAGLARRLGAGPLSWAGIVRGASATHAEWRGANEIRARLELTLRHLFTQYDVILAPATPTAAFPHDHRSLAWRRLPVGKAGAPYLSLLQWPALASACGLPSTVIPAGRTPSGLPVGAQLIGPRGGDSKTLAVAQAIDEQIIGFTPPDLG